MLKVVLSARAARVTRSPDVAANPAPAASLSAVRRPIFNESSFPATIAYLLCLSLVVPIFVLRAQDRPSLRRLQLANIAPRGAEEAGSGLLDVGGRDVRVGHE